MIDSLLAPMRIRSRLILGFGCLLLLAITMGLVALARMDLLDERTRASYEQPFALARLTLQAEQTVERIRRLNRDALPPKAEPDDHDTNPYSNSSNPTFR
jgi:hypothetical protein